MQHGLALGQTLSKRFRLNLDQKHGGKAKPSDIEMKGKQKPSGTQFEKCQKQAAQAKPICLVGYESEPNIITPEMRASI